MDPNSTLLETLQVFLHPEGKFLYFKEQDRMPNNLKIDLMALEEDHANVITLGKTSFTSLSRPKHDRECVEDTSYDWKACLDNLFYSIKGCQDPWYVNPGKYINFN